MALLVFVHGYNLNQGYLQPWTLPGEKLTCTSFTEYWLANGLFRFRIPMLFIISGYLFALGDNKRYRQRAGKRVRTLLYPYLIWSAAGLLLTYCLECFAYGSNIVAATHLVQISDSKNLLRQYHWYEVAARWLFFPVSYQLWFIRVLLVYNLAYPLLRWCILHPIVKWIFFTVVALFWLSTAGFIFIEGEGLLFFSLGIWLQKTTYNIDAPGKWLQPKYWGSIFILLSIGKTVLAFAIPFKGIEPLLLLLHKLVIISGLISTWYGCNALVRWCMRRRWFVWASDFSFMVYVLHAPLVVYATKAVFLQYNTLPYYRLFTFMLLPLCIIMAAIGIGAVLRRCMPRVYSFVTGKRGLAATSIERAPV